MQTFHEVLRNLQVIVYGALAVAAFIMMRRRPDAVHRWLAATFVLLGSILLVSRFLPVEIDSGWVFWVRKASISLLVLFPYCLYRFMRCFRRPIPWVARVALFITGVLAVWALFLPFAAPGESLTPGAQAFVYLLLFQWTSLSLLVAVRLWLGGRGQPNVARRRMQTLALGALGMGAALLIAGTAHRTAEPHLAQAITQGLSLLSAPLFFLGFAPPSAILVLWRRREEEALRGAMIGLVKSETQEEVARLILPHAARVAGAAEACILETSGHPLTAMGIDAPDLEALAKTARAWDRNGDYVMDGRILAFPMEVGWLILVTSPFTPFFGESEIHGVKALAVIADMALVRAQVAERERHNLEAMRDFVAIASHDLRTPVAVVSGFSQMLLADWPRLDDEQKLEMIRSIDRQGGHLARLTEDLLTTSRIEAGRMETRPSWVKLKAAVERTFEDLSAEMSPAPRMLIDPDLKVFVDPDHLERILVNYLRNAYIYGRAPVQVEASNGGKFVRIKVRDGGPGVSEEFVPSLFGKFARADKKMSRATEGTGLGLSIVRGLARAAGGDAWYEPNLPTGSVFAVKLPNAPQSS